MSAGACGLASLDKLAGRECAHMAQRLRSSSAEIQRLAPYVSSTRSAEQADDWSAIEVLAHIAALSAFFTTTALKAASGREMKGDLLDQIRARDLVTAEFATLPTAHLAQMAVTYLKSAIAFLEAPEPVALARPVRAAGDLLLTLEEVIRLGLCAHLEMHIEQLRTALGREAAVMSAARKA